MPGPASHDPGGEGGVGKLLAAPPEVREPQVVESLLVKTDFFLAFSLTVVILTLLCRVWTCWRLCVTFMYLFLDICTTSTIRSDFLYCI